MSEDPVLFTQHDGVACLTLNAPDMLNAMNRRGFELLIEAMDRIDSEPEIRALILTGAGSAFCSGASIQSDFFLADDPAKRHSATKEIMDSCGTPLMEKLAKLRVPTIAAVNGPAGGGGVGLALACDLVIAAPAAKFVLTFTPKLGMIPDLATVWQFARSIGRSRTIRAAYLGTPISAEEAADVGLIWKVVPGESLMEETWSIARQLADGPTQAYSRVRQIVDAATMLSLREQVELEAEIQPRLMATQDMVEGARAFLAKRKPIFKGH